MKESLSYFVDADGVGLLENFKQILLEITITICKVNANSGLGRRSNAMRALVQIRRPTFKRLYAT